MLSGILVGIRSLSGNAIIRAGLVHRGSFYARAVIGTQVYNRRWVNNKTGGPIGNQEVGLRARMSLDLENSSEYLRLQNILLQKNQQRLTKERLLSDASGFFERFKVNTKWILIRGNRPFNGDELSTLFSWLIISQVVWIVLGTTTFVSLLLFLLNTVCAKEMVGKFVGNCLNKFMDGVDVQFRDALIPEWRKGYISFKKVRIMTTEPSESAVTSKLLSFNLHFDEINLTLSVVKWLQGRGLIQNVSVNGMTGDVRAPGNMSAERKLINWFSNPHYELGEVEVSDSCINFHDGDCDMNFKLSIYNLRMNQLRFEWCLLDFFNAEVVSGAINDSLFSVHKRQHKLAYLPEFEQDLSHWSRIARLRLNPISVRQLGLDKSSAFNWMDGGHVDIIADLMFPNSENKTDAEEENKYIVVDLKFTFSDLGATMRPEAPTLSDNKELISLEELSPVINFVNTKRGVFRSLRGLDGTNPLWNTKVSINKQKSYPDTTVISAGAVSWPEGEETISVNREIIKYHDHPHSNGDEIVLKCRIVKDLNELKNIFLFKETGVYDQLVLELYVDLMKVVEESEYKRKNEWMKSWGKNVASQLLIFGLGAIV